MKGTSDEWRWVDPKGVQSTTDKWELVALLSSSELPYYTLVWSRGWAEWLPACRVEELQEAVGERAEPNVKPRLDRTARIPPPPPLFKYHAYLVRESHPDEQRAVSVGPAPAVPPHPPAPFVETDAVVSEDWDVEAGTGPGPTSDRVSDGSGLGRCPMPTLIEEPGAKGDTLRPPAAVPPPPRSVPSSSPRSRPPHVLDDLEPTPSLADTAPRQPPPPQLLPSLPIQDEPAPTTERKPRIEPPRSPLGASRTPLIVAALLTLLAVCLGLVAITVLLSKRGQATQSSVPSASSGETVSESSASPSPVAAAPKQCLLARSGRRLYGAAYRSIPPLLLTLPDQRVAVGFASNPTTAVGLSVDPSTLVTKQELLKTGDARVFTVVPLWNDALEFAIDREGGELTQAQTLAKGLRVGIGKEGFIRERQDSSDVVWEGGGDAPTTAPRAATVGDRGYAVTFRRGGQEGDVLAGWLKPDGSRDSALKAIRDEGLAGTPSVAANPSEILVTFASRPDGDAKWGVALARAPHGELPKEATPFIIPPGGPGVETMAPSATGLDDGRWLLQWTEGATGNRQVRVQTLAADLTPVGDAITLSAVEDNAGQGVVHAVGGQVVSLFLVIRGGEPQLWTAALKCE